MFLFRFLDLLLRHSLKVVGAGLFAFDFAMVRKQLSLQSNLLSICHNSFKKKTVFVAIGIIIIRILKCHPYSVGGKDPVK